METTSDVGELARAPAAAREVEIANERFETQTLRIERNEATGRDLIEALGRHPAEDFVVLRYRPDGSLEEVGLETVADLAEPRRNSFFVNAAIEMVNLVIDEVRLTWTQTAVTGLTIKHLARRAGEEIDVWLEREGEPDKLIEDDEVVHLGRHGLERFRLRSVREVEIKVNTNPVMIQRGWRTGSAIKAAAIAQGVDIKTCFTLSEELPDGGSKLIGDVDPVHIKGGEQFLAIDDHDDS